MISIEFLLVSTIQFIIRYLISINFIIFKGKCFTLWQIVGTLNVLFAINDIHINSNYN